MTANRVADAPRAAEPGAVAAGVSDVQEALKDHKMLESHGALKKHKPQKGRESLGNHEYLEDCRSREYRGVQESRAALEEPSGNL